MTSTFCIWLPNWRIMVCKIPSNENSMVPITEDMQLSRFCILVLAQSQILSFFPPTFYCWDILPYPWNPKSASKTSDRSLLRDIEETTLPSTSIPRLDPCLVLVLVLVFSGSGMLMKSRIPGRLTFSVLCEQSLTSAHSLTYLYY